MAKDEQRPPIDQLVDVFVYAPIGLLYEYQEVLPKLVKRGKSQVQIAKLLGTMAAKKGQQTVESRLAEGITDVGARVGLAPDPAAKRDAGSESANGGDPAPAEESEERPLPIANYDDLTAKQIVALLPDLDAGQRERVRRHEAANRSRKTVMAKLEALSD